MPDPIAQHAVVVGAGMGGLTAAKVLSSHSGHVTVLERDALPETAGPRNGIPQGRHAHVLLAGGQRALAELFPGIEEELEHAGAIKTRVGLDVIWERPGYDPYPQRDLGFDTLSLSRPLLEFVTRRRLAQETNVSVRSHGRVIGPVVLPESGAVTAVRCEFAEGAVETIPADLVVDATGRATLTLAALEALGFEKPEESEIGIDQTYATAIFEIPEDAPAHWLGLIHLPTPPHSGRGGFIFPMEHGKWIVSLGSNHGDVHPGDIDGFMAFARELRTATLYHAVRNAKLLEDVTRYRLPASVRRHFEKLQRFPRGLLPIGDSICRFNPVFGQGMSVASQEAVTLSRVLQSSANQPLDNLAPAFFAAIQGLLEAPWATAQMDFAYPKTRGTPPPDFASRLQYGAALTWLAAEDAAVHRIVAEVNSLIAPQSALREPDLANRVRELMMASA